MNGKLNYIIASKKAYDLVLNVRKKVRKNIKKRDRHNSNNT